MKTVKVLTTSCAGQNAASLQIPLNDLQDFMILSVNTAAFFGE